MSPLGSRRKRNSSSSCRTCGTVMRSTMALPFLLGLANFAQKAVLANPDRLENVIEWIVSLLMQLWFLWLYAVWRETRFEIDVRVR